MARGWESKAIESQQEEAARKKTRPERTLSAAARATLEKRRGIELALANARSDLAAARAPAHRSMLAQKIEALETQLSKLAPE